MNPLFVVIMGIIFLRERLNKLEISGIVVILLGTIIISLKGASNIDSIFIPGVQYVLISGLIYSIATVIAKKQIMFVDASLMALSRILLLFIFSVGALIVLDLPIIIPSSAFKNVAIGSVLGPFFNCHSGIPCFKIYKSIKSFNDWQHS